VLDVGPRRASRTLRGARTPWWRLLLGLASWAICVVVAVSVAARVMGGGKPWPMPKVAPFALLMVPFAVLAVVLALVARRWVALAVSVLLLAPLLVWEVPAALPGGDESAAGSHRLTVMEFNTKVGVADPAALLREVEARGVDVLVLAESEGVFLTALLDGGLSSRLRYGDPHDPASTVQIWSRWPVTALPPVNGTMDPGPRAVVQTPWGPVTVIGVHTTSPVSAARIGEWEHDLTAVGAAARATTGRQLVVGDFNAGMDHQPFRNLLSGAGLVDAAAEAGLGHGWPAFTWPADRSPVPPLVGIDHVLVRGGVRVRGVSTVEIAGSDHLALVASLTLDP
jgi:endonuclease/exonuclease/phosphatase (EEP) superfamily protein YafD